MNVEIFAKLMGAGKYAAPLAMACGRWGIVDRTDVARFIAQLSVESAGFKHVVELTGWRAESLFKTFKGRNGLGSVQEAQWLVDEGPQRVLNFVYGGSWGLQHLGNTEPNDGWNFRGRGLIQTTGRSNYRDTSMGCYGNKSLLDEPDKLATPDGAAESAAWYWYHRGLNDVEDVREVTRRINGGLHQLDQRIAETERAYLLVDHAT